jgi:hypothetical protein
MTRWQAIRLLPLVLTPLLAQAQGLALHTGTGSELGIQLYGQAYEADRNGTTELALESRKLGVTGRFTQALADGWYWGGEGRYGWGATTYTSAARGRNSANPETLAEVRMIGGRDFDLGTQLWSPYAGLGYRSVDSQLKGYTDTGYVSPSRIGNLVYLPVGITHRLRLAPDARLSTTLEGDYLLGGTQTTRYTDIAGYVSDLNVTQKKGYGARLGLAYETPSWSVGLFFHYWNLQESEPGTYATTTTVYTATEAPSVTRETGIQLTYRFR